MPQAKLDKIRDRYEAIVLKRERAEQQRIAEEALAIKREAAALYIQVCTTTRDGVTPVSRAGTGHYLLTRHSLGV